MATTVSELQVVVSADTKKAESELSSFSSKLGSVGSSMALAFGAAAVGGIVAVGAAASSSVMKFAEFQSQMNILKVTTQATDEQMASMAAQARALGSDMDLPATSSAGAAIAMLELAKAGLSVEQTQMAAKGALQLAAAAGIDEAKAAQLTAGALNAFGLEGSRATSIANQLAYAANASSLDATDLGQAVAQAGFIFKATGQPVESLIAAMIELGNAGLSGSDGATAVKNALMQATNPTDGAKKAMREYGISLFDAKGQMKDLPSIIDHLNAQLGPLTEQQRNAALATIFQGDGMKALIPLMAAGGEKLREHEANLKTTNAASEQAQARAQGLEGAWKGLVSQWETAQEALGSKLAPAIETLIRSSADGIGSITPMLESVGEQIGNALVSGITTAKDLLRQLGDAYRTVKQVFTEGGWSPSAEIEPLANAAGIAATKVRDLANAIQQAADKAGQMGAWDNFGRGVSTLGKELDGIAKHLSEISTALGRVNDASGGAESKINLLAAAIKVVGTAFELWALSMGQLHDTLLTFASISLDMISMAGNIGKALTALAKGDMAAFDAAANEAAQSFISAWTKGADASERTAARAKAAFAAVSGSAGTEMAATASAVETNMAAANTAVSEGSSGMQGFMEANMVSITGSAQTGMAGVTGAVETGMGQAVAGIEAAGPQMAAAAESGAASAVAAVEGQSGAASAAGASVGNNLGQGMEGGILAWVGRVASAARQMVAAALGAGEAEGEIRSPSKKTEYMGRMLDEGLVKGIEGSAPEVQAAMRDLIQGVTDYAPVAREIARVEAEIKSIRESAQTDALFREEEMITVNSEILRLKRDQAQAERDMLPIKQDLLAAEQEVRDISQGSLEDRAQLLSFDSQRRALRLQTLDLEKQLVLAGKDESRKKQIQDQIDKLRDQDRLLGIEADKIRTSRDLAADSARARALGLGEILASQERGSDAIKRGIDILAAEVSVFQANENIIKNATDNEIGYRERLIAVFTAEGKPLKDRITTGLALIDQLKAEGKISDELAGKLKAYIDDIGKATGGTASLGNAAATAAPQIGANAEKMNAMAMAAAEVARKTGEASGQVSALASSLNKLPSWFTPKGGSAGSSAPPSLFSPVAPVLAPAPTTGGGGVPGGSIVPGQGTVPGGSIVPLLGPRGDSAGPTQTHVFQVAGPDGQTLAEWYVRGREVAISYGRATS